MGKHSPTPAAGTDGLRAPGRWALLLLILGAMGYWNLPAGAQIYKWVDKDGVTHFSNTAPQGRGAPQAQKMEEWQHDPDAHAARMEVTEAAQESELQQYQEAREAIRREAEEQRRQTADQNARETELRRKIKFEQQRLEGLIHEDRSEKWNTHVRAQLKLLETDPETYFEFQLEQEGRFPTQSPETPPIQEEDLKAENGNDLLKGPHVVDPYTGELIPEEGGVGSRGTPYIKSGEGYLNTRTGRFFEIP